MSLYGSLLSPERPLHSQVRVSSKPLAFSQFGTLFTTLPRKISRNSSLINSLRTLCKTTEGCLPARADLSRRRVGVQILISPLAFPIFDAKSFTIRSYANFARNSFRIRSYEKQPGWGLPSRARSRRRSGGNCFPLFAFGISIFDLRRSGVPTFRGFSATCQLRGVRIHRLMLKSNHRGGDTVSTEAVATRRHAGSQLPVTGWKLELPTTTWHLLLN